MSRTGLGRYGIVPASIVRTPARDRDGLIICPECGAPVSASKGTPHIRYPDVVDDDLEAVVGDRLITHGWVCERHQYDVVLPARANALNDRWAYVPLRFSDGEVRDVPTPKREINEEELA